MEKLLKAKDVSEHLSISRSRAYGLMRSGEIPTVKFGKSVRVRIEDIERFILIHQSNNDCEEYERRAL